LGLVFPPETKSFNNQMASSVDRTTKQNDNETSIEGSLFFLSGELDLPCVDDYTTLLAPLQTCCEVSAQWSDGLRSISLTHHTKDNKMNK
jgi:hypothetical protein